MLLSLVCLCSCAGIPARGVIGGQAVDARVDSEIAGYFLSSYRGPGIKNPALQRRIEAIDGNGAAALPDRNTLKRLSDEFSTDFAALYFADRLARLPENGRFRALYDRARVLAQHEPRRLSAALRAAAADYEIVFIPGYLYRRHRMTGADLGAPRAALREAGLDSIFIETSEEGPVEANAERIAAAIRTRPRGRRLILVSVSKSGPEVALALTQLGTKAAQTVAAWVNVSGTLQGTPLADDALVGWEDLIGRVDPAGVASLSTARSRQRFTEFRVPRHVFVLNYIGVPLAAGVSWLARSGYAQLRAHGPSDGLSLLPDLIYPGGVTVAEIGLDHFLLDAQDDTAVLALALTVLEHAGSADSETMPGRESARAEQGQ